MIAGKKTASERWSAATTEMGVAHSRDKNYQAQCRQYVTTRHSLSVTDLDTNYSDSVSNFDAFVIIESDLLSNVDEPFIFI